MAKDPKKKAVEDAGTMTDDSSPIGVNDDGTLNVVDPDAPPWRPRIIDKDGNEVDPDSIEGDESDE